MGGRLLLEISLHAVGRLMSASDETGRVRARIMQVAEPPANGRGDRAPRASVK